MVLFARLGGLSPTGEIRALDATADGVLFADGASIVVLKRLSRAVADGDQILGVLSGIGLSADGKGKAINAPSTRGQVSAARQALRKSSVDPGEVDMVVAHATGTPVGDLTEMLGIGEVYTRNHPVTVVSTKAVIGHTGWAAGTASLIHLLLCLRHNSIPAQPRFNQLPAQVTEQAPMISVPRQAVPWAPHTGPASPEPVRPRHGVVAGFGFGGTNATVIVSEYLPTLTDQPHAAAVTATPEPLVIVGWSAREPGDGTPDFGPVYPIPPFTTVALPPPLARAIDRGQLLAVEAMQALPPQVREFCQQHRDTTGVIVGYMGQTYAMSTATLRVHLDDIDETLLELHTAGMPQFLSQLRRHVHSLGPQLGQDSMAGSMPNVIASRIANYFDFRGLNLLVDGGQAGLLQAFGTAACFLDDHDLDIALVAGMSANVHPAWSASISSELSPHAGIAEGAYLFAVTRHSTAQQAGLAVLATLDR